MIYKNVERFVTRFGKVLYYYRPGKGRRVPIKAAPEDPDFSVHYERAVAEWRGRQIHSLDAEGRKEVAGILAKRIKNARARDSKIGRKSDVTLEWALEQLEKQDYRCAVTGISFLLYKAPGRINPYHPSLDRIDNSKGYEKTNVRLVIFAVNMMMLDWGDRVFDHVARAYVGRKRPQTNDEPSLPLLKRRA